MENFSKIQKFSEECKAGKEEIERALTKLAIFEKLAKKLDKHEIDNFKVAPLVSVLQPG